MRGFVGVGEGGRSAAVSRVDGGLVGVVLVFVLEGGGGNCGANGGMRYS